MPHAFRVNRNSRLLKSFFVVVICAGVLVFLQVTRAQVLKADYQFQNTRNSSTGSSVLVDTGSVNTFQTDTVDGTSRTVLRFPFNNGLRLSQATAVMPANSYTIVMLFKLDNVTGFRRLIDFKNRTNDDGGAYIDNGQLEFCQTCTNIPANTYVQVVYTRNSSGTVAGYVNGVLQGQLPDANNLFVIDGSNTLNFFQDDLQFPNEASAGSVARIRLYDAPMTAAEVAALPRLPLTTITVTNTNDSGAGSFRQALLDANTDAGTQTINFSIPGSGVHTISPASALPTITGPVIINGTTQPSFSGSPLIELNGANAGAGVSGLAITGGGSTVRGLVINRFNAQAVSLANGGSNTIAGNYIGTDATGTSDLGNAQNGVLINAASINNVVGGTTAADRNIISGNDTNGVLCNGNNTNGNQIRGNYIGTNAAGSAAVPNSFSGVNIIGPSTGNIIGGTAVGTGNVISGNTGRGIIIQVATATNNLVQGNLIGLAADGITKLGNTGVSGFGVSITTAPNNTIGGTATGARNVISGNDVSGVLIQNSSSTGNIVQGNFIGTDVSGNAGVPNNGQAGVLIRTGANNNTIGGTAPGAGNRITFNLNAGVFIQDAGSIRNAILSNSIFSNGRLGINLQAGGNNNFDLGSVSTTATSNGTNTTVQGTFAAAANTTYNVQSFSNVSCDPSGFGEGQTLLGSVNVTTAAGGTGTINQTFPTNVPAGQFVTFTATDPLNNTSRFSRCQQVNASVLITGSVKNSANVGISGVTITLSGTQSSNTLTDANGNYSFNLTAGTYTLTPERINLSFLPQSTTVSSNATVNFTASTTSGPGGKIVFVSTRNGSNEIYTMNADGSGQTRLTNNTAADVDPTWSPNGARIVFESDRAGNFDVFTMNADGTSQTNLTNNAALDDSASWSPDGTKIAFSSNRDGNGEIYVMNADGTSQTRLTNSPGVDEVPAWSPDGTRIAFSSTRDGNTEIYVMTADGNNQSRLTNNTATDDSPAWSPDGTRIAFHSNRDGNFEIYAMNVDGSNQTRLTNDVGGDVSPSYSPDGTQITFATSRDPQGDSEIYLMKADGSTPTNISNTPFATDTQPTWQTQAALPQVFRISGRLVDDSGNSLSGISVTLTGAGPFGATTDIDGNYSFTNLAVGGTYTVTPSSGTYSFNPVNQTFNNLASNRIANFVGTQTVVSIGGTLTDINNAGVNNVTLALTKDGTAAGTVQTDGLGNYSFANLAAGANYLVTPTGSFAPSSQTLSNLTVNATANFKAAATIPPQCNTTSFAAASNFAVGNVPNSVATGDFSGDGKLDLAVANSGSNNVSIFLGTGTGTFSPAVIFPATTNDFPVGSSPFAIAVGDFNTDGKVDLAVANNGSANVSILFGAGTGSFSAATNFAVGTNPLSVTTGDFDGDGKLDLAVSNGNSNNVSILLGTGAGSFGAAANFAVGQFPMSVTPGDFNSDGKLDLVVANGNDLSVSMLPGTGTGSFGAATNSSIGGFPASFAVGDFDADGKLDLAVARQATFSNVSIFRGTGTGSFVFAADVSAGWPEYISVGDFNGDGKLDLALSSSNVSILLGTGTGSFSAATNFAVGSSPRSITVGDFNADGRPDLGVANRNSNNVSILLNNGTSCSSQSSLTISGQITGAGNEPLSSVTVTLSGPVTRVIQSDINGNYSFANLVPGGNYAVTVQSAYYVFAPARVDLFNLSSSQIANFVAAAVAVPAPSPPLTDDFTSAVRDATKWNLGTQTQPAAAVDPQVTTAQINGQLVIKPVNQASGMHYNGYVAANSFDIRNGKATVEVVKAATGGADTIFAIGSDSDNFFRFLVHTAGAPTSLVTVKVMDGLEAPLDTATAQLIFQVKINGQFTPSTPLSIDYDPLAHRFMRFRHEPPAVAPSDGAIVFETSPNNIDFTVRHRILLEKRVDPLAAELSAGTSSPTNSGPAVFDNLTLTTSTFQFSAGAYTVGEGDGSVLITVTRAGAVTDAASVDYATTDGTARQGSKYLNAAGTLTFAAGQTSKTFSVLIVDTNLAEGNQTVNLLLGNPAGAGFNSPGRAVLNIVDNDTVLTPIFQPVALTAGQAEIKTWTTGGRTYAYLKLSFPNAGHRVASWGQAVRAGNDFTADAAVERFTGASVQAVTTTAQIYDLGTLSPGSYNFTFKNTGTVVKTLAFTVAAPPFPANPIDVAREFVKQQYRDFLNREADQAGEDFWTDNITLCSDPARKPAGQTVEQCTLRQRETTSGAFFLSPEFQYTGYYVLRMYQGALGRQPKLSEFTPDAQFVGAGILVNSQLSGAKINQNKADYAQQFVNCTDAAKSRCAEFKAIYDGLNNQQYVDKLFQTTGVNANTADRAALVNGLNANPATETRASVLQKVVDGIVVISEGNQQFTTSYGQEFYNSESNRAFVQLEYFGYMKRDPDDAGYAFWLGKLNQFGGNFVNAEMVLAFISSPEYRARFGQP